MIRALALTAMAALPASAQDSEFYACAGISRHFQMCPEGTAWVLVECEPYGDGATGHLGMLDFDYAEDWAGRAGHEAMTVDAALAALVAERPATDVVTHLTDKPEVDGLVLARTIQTIDSGDEDPILRAWMIAEAAPGVRIMLVLTAPEDFPLDEMDRRSAELAGVVRMVEGDE